jgi:antirestriction protein ArdC
VQPFDFFRKELSMYEQKWTQLLDNAVTTPGLILKAYTAFHQYSLLNQWAAMAQCAARDLTPGPMKTFQGWKELNRYVRKGEKAIWLCRPLTRKNEADENVVVSFNWKPFWFVLSQTDGADIELTALPEWNAERALLKLDITHRTFQTMDGNAQGYAKGRSVAINPVAELPHKTLFHELAHVVLGHTAEGDLADDERTPCNLREVEAEAVAMVLCESLELPGAPYCRGYIQHWLREGQAIPNESARKILHAADVILRAGQAETEKP